MNANEEKLEEYRSNQHDSVEQIDNHVREWNKIVWNQKSTVISNCGSLWLFIIHLIFF